MSVGYKGEDISVLAGESLINDKYRAVRLSNEMAYRPDTATGLLVHGILQNAPASGEAAVVRISGISKIVAADAISENAAIAAEWVDATDAGKGITTTTDNHFIIGFCVEAAGAENDLAGIHIVKSFHSIT